MSRRFIVPNTPILHINGKLAPIYVKCRNTHDPDKVEQDGFLYGYSKRTSKKNCFAVRQRSRYLETNPYTQAETENRALFTLSLYSVYQHRQIPADWALCLQDFKQQKNYLSPLGYAVAQCRQNQGLWLDKWTA